jgi:hypothetical protein
MKLAEATKKTDYIKGAIKSLRVSKNIMMAYIRDKNKDDEATLQAAGKEFGEMKESNITADNAYAVISQIDDMILLLMQSNDDMIFSADEISAEKIYRRK